MPAIRLNVYITPFAGKSVRAAETWRRDMAPRGLNAVGAISSKANPAFLIDCVVDKPLDRAESVRNDLHHL
jgi:hypothetical protein